MDDFKQQLAQHTLIGLDTSIFIYHYEAHPRYLPLTTLLLNRIQAGEANAITSVISIMELTVQPIRQQKPEVARQYEAILANFPHLTIGTITRAVARQAGQLRAIYNIKAADALQVAVALSNKATVFVSNDKQLSRLEPKIKVLVLEDFCNYTSGCH